MSYAVLVAASRRLLGAEAVDALAPGPYVMPGAAEIDVRQVAVEERPALSRTRRSRGPVLRPRWPETTIRFISGGGAYSSRLNSS